MSATNRSTLIAKSYKILKKHYQPVPPVERSVLETLVYGACLENTKYEAADTAFAKIKKLSYDWNEVRVTTVTELSESMTGLPEPKQAAANVRRLLHGVFESIYSYNLEHLKKQNLGKSIKELAKHKGSTTFVIGHVTQHALSGHSIPLDRGALDVLYISGIIDEKERKKEKAPGLERAVAKAKGIEFASLLHQLAADLVASPFSPKIRAILMEINPDGKDRLPKRKTKKKAKPEAPKKKVPVKSAKKPAAKKTTGTGKKTATKKKDPAKKKDATSSKQGTKKVAKKKTTKKKAMAGKKTATKKKGKAVKKKRK